MDNKKGKCCGCPAQMSDGNFVTNHQSARNYINKQIKKKKGLSNHHDYRNYLQKSAEQIIEKQSKFFEDNMKCNFFKNPEPPKKPVKKVPKKVVKKAPKKVVKKAPKKVVKKVTKRVTSKSVTQTVISKPTTKTTTTITK